MRVPPRVASWLQVAPMAFVFTAMVLIPLTIIFIVSFLDYDFARVFPEIYWGSWQDALTSRLTLDLYTQVFKFLIITWCVTFVVGFSLAYFLVFHLESNAWRMGLLAAAAIPFWTPGPIRMVSWVPLLGKEGLVNKALMGMGITDAPLDWLLYSEFAVILAYCNLLTLAMLGPITHSMAKIPRSLIQAAQDSGAREWQIIRDVILPLAKPGIAIGTIFIITAVLGDFFMIKIMSGGQINTPANAIATELAAFQYPPAAAKSVVLLVVVVFLISMLLRFVDIRKELQR
ncbi:MAG: ABC transporter permease [Rhodobacteraceae bacterium]|nr:ABC transporter permease [Paracoccaceae bacterium]MAY44854.1 ABC transporter permease [Paracoccaceae bacterium]QEW18090.1 Spermidine/putrescine transport system permease protein PotB [Marinibacterium anthonyi]|tara:strand:- start:278 stop:1138 length:861 start_codon:yes stop_codon:yes gene_type:complete